MHKGTHKQRTCWRVLGAALSLMVTVGAGAEQPTVPSHVAGASASDGPSVAAQYVADHPELLGQDPGCVSCHSDIENATENMGFALSCVMCHGGDPIATVKDEAHVLPTLPVIMDKTSPPLDYDLPYQQFVNPSNLRVVEGTCGMCHPWEVELIMKSMMTSTAGHFSGGLYQNGTVDTQTPLYANYPVADKDGVIPTELGAVESLDALLEFDPAADPSLASTHYAAVPAQACARCHLWSRGKGYRGAEGQDGVYRADGCVACHMPYANDGLSLSADALIDHAETGHPKYHRVVRNPPTEQCLHCHHRGARIGLSFTGRAQMPPDLPSGPGVPGTTDVRFNGNYHYVDAETNPPDIHDEMGMHCIDCHTKGGVMGDGNLWGHMDQATKIRCRMCHGMPDARGTLIDRDGYALRHVSEGFDGNVHLRSKVTSEDHIVRQVQDLVNPMSSEFNPRAACSMDGNHLKEEGGLECFACHSYWTPNCFGCHFERDERFMGLNLITREEEVGRVKTNNKVFESLKHFFLGPNAKGKISPYIVSCHPIADVTAPDGSKILDMVMPQTANGKSGLGHNPVNPHTVRGRNQVRTCAECHRSPPSLGFGSGNYALARDFAFVAAADGVRVFDRRTDPANPDLVGTLPTGAPHAIATVPDIVEGVANFLYVAAGTAGVYIYDMGGGFPIPPTTMIDGINAIDVARVARYVYVTVAGVGINVYDNAAPLSVTLVGSVPIPTAVRAVPWGIHLFVPAGEDGLYVLDISDHNNPRVVGHLAGMNAVDVRLYAHFQMGRHFAARAYVADPDYGVRVVDLLPNFDEPLVVGGIPLIGAQGLDTYSAYVDAHDTVPSREHDYLYVAAGAAGLHVFDITVPDAITGVAALTNLGGHAMDVDVASEMTPPGVDDYALVANSDLGLQVIGVSDPQNPVFLTTVAAAGASRVMVEVQQMDRFVDEMGEQLKENSHPGITLMSRHDIVRLLSIDITADCLTPSDFDGDWTVDVIDFAHFSACVTGPDGVASPGCSVADADHDGDVDFADFAAMQLTFSGP